MYDVLILSAVLSFILNFILQRLFIRYNFIDNINERSSHDQIATRSGGSSVYIVLFLISIISYLFGFALFDYSVLVPLSILFLIGLYDDIYNVDFKLKFIFQVIVAKMIIDNGLVIDNFHGFFGFYEINRILSQLLTIFIIVAIINAINFIDGIDGLAISISFLFLISFEFFAFINTDFYYLSIIIFGSLIPMYYFNFRKKNKVFLGDSGSYLLGGLICLYVLKILSQGYLIKPEFDLNKVLFVVSLLIYPIIDIIRIFFMRIIQGKSPFLADKNHIHHKILSKSNSHYLTVLIIITGSILFIISVQILF